MLNVDPTGLVKEAQVTKTEQQYECQKCAICFDLSTDLTEHMDNTHKTDSIEPLGLSAYPVRSTASATLAHVKTYSKIKFNNSRDDSSNVNPMEQQRTKQPYTCPKCEYTFEIITDLTRHMEKTHNIDSIKRLALDSYLVSPTASVPSPTSPEILEVQMIERLYECPKCDLRFGILTDLTKHMEKIHNINSIERLGLDSYLVSSQAPTIVPVPASTSAEIIEKLAEMSSIFQKIQEIVQ